MTLTHVCMWDNKGWKRITAKEAARLHPGGTVPAQSGLFMCELCGQYVLLTNNGCKVRHFRHSSLEKSKDCPERAGEMGVPISYNANEHALPIRLTCISGSDFEFEIGFIQVPVDLLTSKLRIEIKSNLYNAQTFVYLKERLSAEGITYLPVGNVPAEKYFVNIFGTNIDKIQRFWPATIQGIDPSGTIFDASTGKKLVYDSDVVIGEKYYLLKQNAIRKYNPHVYVREVSKKRIEGKTWYVYEVAANDYDKMSACFFLDYHCRLTENPVVIQPVWPVYTETPYVIKYNCKSVVMHIKGNAYNEKVFPATVVKKYFDEDVTVLELFCNSRQQLISAGRTKALQYMYFWQEPLNQITKVPTVVATDVQGRIIEAGEYNALPDNKILRIIIPYDGMLTIVLRSEIIEKRKLRAEIPSEIDNLTWGVELRVCVGLDCLWKVSYIRKTEKNTFNEKEILQKLQMYSGDQISISHSIGSLIEALNGYPGICRWLYKCVRTGSMSRRAFRYLQSLVIKNNAGTLKE